MGSLYVPTLAPSPCQLGIVLARYKEDITPWVKFAENTYVYAKFPTPQANDTVDQSLFREYVPRPNVGRETETYLNHIVSKYDLLDDITIFSQANPFDIIVPMTNTTTQMVQDSLDTPIDDATIYNKLLLHDVADWARINWTSPTESIWVTPSEISGMTLSPYTPAQFWSLILGVEHPPAIRALHGACFAVRRETIRKYPIELYQRALDQFHRGGGSLDPEEGFYMERMWLPLWSKKYWLPRIEHP